MKTYMLALLLGLGAAQILYSETVLLKDGSTKEGKIVMRSGSSILLETAPGVFEKIATADVEKIQKGTTVVSGRKVVDAAEAAQVQQQAPPTASSTEPLPKVDIAALAEEVAGIFKYMKNEPLAKWPEPEKSQVVAATDPAGKDWKVQKRSGVVYMEEAPAPAADIDGVWAKGRSQVVVVENIVGVGSFDRTPAATWIRMYWHEKTKDWGASHPNDLGFRRGQDYVIAMIQKMAEASDRQLARKLNGLWYDLLNSGGNDAKKNKTLAEMKSLASRLGSPLQIGNRLWLLYEMAARVNSSITPSATTVEKVRIGQEQTRILEETMGILKSASK